MTYPISAGVYPREIDQSFIVGAVANSIGGIVINSNKGTTGELKLITSNKEFIDQYGTPLPSNPSMYSALAFLEQGNRLLVARAINDAVASSAEIDDDAALKAFDVTAQNEGAWGNNISVRITTRVASAAITAGGTTYLVGDILTVASGTGTAAQFVVTSVAAGVVDGIELVEAGAYSVNPTSPDTVTTDSVAGSGCTLTLTMSETFTLDVLYNGAVVETYETTRDPLQKDGFGKSMYLEDVINGQSMYITVTDDLTNVFGTDHVAPVTEALVSGSDDTTAPDDADINTAWDLFATKEEVEVSLLINGGWATPAVQTKMLGIAESRLDCFCIFDFASADDTVAEMTKYRKVTLNKNTSYAALYAGYLYVYDQYNDKYMYLPPSGYIAGVFAKTAQVSEVWYAPAGQRRGVLNVLGVKTVWTEGQRDTLYTAQINPIQSFTGEGIQVYGQKTLQTAASATDRVNVRMLLIQIEKAISKSLRPFVFEFNDTFTRENISSIINSYMNDVKTRRGVYDFLTVCDTSNNTPLIIDQNKLIIDLYVKPTRVAEFVQLNVVVTNTGATFTVS